MHRGSSSTAGAIQALLDYVTRWEQVEPLRHRVPLPAKVCDAVTALAFAWKWFRFGLVLQICYHIVQVREVIAATREDLVLASDFMADRSDKFYLLVAKPLTGKRGGGRQQHVAVVHGALSSSCESFFRDFERSLSFQRPDFQTTLG